MRVFLVAAAALALPDTGGRSVRTTNCAAGEEVGFFVWGNAGGADLPKVFQGSCGDSISIDGVSTHGSSAKNAIVAFSKGHPPVLTQGVDWNSQSPLAVRFEAEKNIRIQFWVLHKTADCDFTCQSDKTAAILLKANTIFHEERVGIRLVENGPPVDLTGRIEDPFREVLDLREGGSCEHENASIAALTSRHKSGDALNMYVIRTVGGVSDRGNSCRGQDYSFVGSRVLPGTGAHEVAHNLGLVHPLKGSSLLGRRRNLMHPDSASRKYLTEGQVFWMHYSDISAMPTVFGIRRDLARSCLSTTPDPPCPKEDARIWPD